MVSHNYKCIFVHIPKAAGQSVENFFLQKLNLTWKSRLPLLLCSNNNPEIGPPKLAHMTASEYVQHHYISQELFENYFKFSFVRNPWSRAVSFYKFLGYDTIISFDVFASDVLPKLLKKKNFFLKPQHDFLYKDGKLIVDFVGRFENINNDFNKICKQLGFTEYSLPHVNKGEKKRLKGFKTLSENPGLIYKLKFAFAEHKNYTAYYTDKTKNLIYEIYKNDVNTFGYEFQ